ncbi:(2Fe-2S)-binding protein [Rhodoplanes sp. Z2-YC6860]|uniref:(2Fe-2S)-binding protein n=1 Tax=Rhodoplanes sp. Z2-YC6860 TaxID=674703 RepID=UPI00078D1DC4|nr:(2Fe-2S)-binding protein [Rhodoplanes sp. Z2-YC6860]AMN44657.1 (2Fe-2S)-binding domain protein [Rhodoplanes sp. Z2-YC6860]
MSDVAISFELNGKPHKLTVAPNMTLADLLRERFALNGCKVGCDEGVCGACTVIVDGASVSACNTFAFAIDGRSIATIEGLANAGTLHRVQEAFLESGAFQCGFCTSGMILSIATLLAREPKPDEATIRDWLAGNICRCTGYRQIRDAIERVMHDAPAEALS